MILLLFILIPYFLRKPIVYDSSTLYVLSKDDRHSKLSRRAIRPEGHIDKIPGLERIKKTMPIRDIDGMKRLQDEYGLLDYDAMALKLAEESGATLYTADKRIYEIGKRLGISVKLLDRKENT
jgi:predicted nucleic acid-binding protein